MTRSTASRGSYSGVVAAPFARACRRPPLNPGQRVANESSDGLSFKPAAVRREVHRAVEVARRSRSRASSTNFTDFDRTLRSEKRVDDNRGESDRRGDVYRLSRVALMLCHISIILNDCIPSQPFSSRISRVGRWCARASVDDEAENADGTDGERVAAGPATADLADDVVVLGAAERLEGADLGDVGRPGRRRCGSGSARSSSGGLVLVVVREVGIERSEALLVEDEAGTISAGPGGRRRRRRGRGRASDDASDGASRDTARDTAGHAAGLAVGLFLRLVLRPSSAP